MTCRFQRIGLLGTGQLLIHAVRTKHYPVPNYPVFNAVGKGLAPADVSGAVELSGSTVYGDLLHFSHVGCSVLSRPTFEMLTLQRSTSIYLRRMNFHVE